MTGALASSAHRQLQQNHHGRGPFLTCTDNGHQQRTNMTSVALIWDLLCCAHEVNTFISGHVALSFCSLLMHSSGSDKYCSLPWSMDQNDSRNHHSTCISQPSMNQQQEQAATLKCLSTDSDQKQKDFTTYVGALCVGGKCMQHCPVANRH